MSDTKRPYSLEEYLISRKGDGSNMLRGDDYAQPRALVSGDILSNGWRVLGISIAYNSSVGVHFERGLTRILPPRAPLKLRSERPGVLPADLKVGHILQTACVVLTPPKEVHPVPYHENQEELELKLTGGLIGHEVYVPTDIELAVTDEVFPPSPKTLLGMSAISGVASLRPDARRSLFEVYIDE